jgi:hypothetical protein
MLWGPNAALRLPTEVYPVLDEAPFPPARGPLRAVAWALSIVVVAATAILAAAGPPSAAGWSLWAADPLADGVATADGVDHLVVSEVMTGAASASDEFIELYNPTPAALPLEGLEIVYVTASGATVTRKAAWPAGEPALVSGGHLLVANEAGAFAAIADVTYANGLAATGGSVALRIIGASSAIDAVGWGTAASTWLEGQPAPAVAAGHSLERLPGGAAGSGQDTDANAADFVDRPLPDPQNRAAAPIPIEPVPSLTPTPLPTASGLPTPSALPTATPVSTSTATPTPSASPTPTPPTPAPATPTPEPTPTAAPALTVAEARALPDGSSATIQAVSLTNGAFADGGGCVADGTAGIAVLVDGGSFARGSLLTVSGELDDRFHQRTLRATPDGVAELDVGAEPAPLAVTTGTLGEPVECRLVSATGSIVSSATELSGALAFDFDDGTGPTRLVVPDAAGIDASGWARDTILSLRGVVMQRDSSGSGTAGYRLIVRDPADVLSVQPPSPSGSPSPSGDPSASPSPSDDPSVVSIAAARRAAPNTRLRVRGTVTLPTSVLGDGTAAIQDASGAIILRLGDEAGALSIGDLVQVDGMRSTFSGMETLRVSVPPQRLGSPAMPQPARHPTGSLGEAQEARLVVVRGAVSISPRRTSAANVYFDVDDGSGPLRVYLTPGSEIGDALALGDEVEIVGVLGQETSGQQPLRGYRLWPRRPADVRIVAAAGETDAGADGEPTSDGGSGSPSVPAAGAGSSAAPAAAWPAGIPRPRLVPAGVGSLAPTAEPTTSPDPRATSAAGPSSGAAGLLFLVAAGALGAVAAVAAARPGLLQRLGDATGRIIGSGDRSAEADGTPGEAAAAGSSLETAVAHLVPLRVIDEPSVTEGASSVDSRSAVRRILPPT